MKRAIGMAGLATWLLAAQASAQDFTYHPPAAATARPVPREDGPNCGATLRFGEFAGRKVVFVAKTGQFRRFGYQSYFLGRMDAPSPAYEKLAGQVATIETIGARDAIGFQAVRLRLDATGEVLMTRALRESLSDVVLLDDIAEARRRWIGKTLWYKGDRVRLSQEADLYAGPRIRKYQPGQVLDVVAGTDGLLDFVMQIGSGLPALIGVRFSGSNLSPDVIDGLARLHRRACTFDELFETADPRLAHRWPAAIWSAIELGQVTIGMTTEQATMAWGEPRAINETRTATRYSAQWVYSGNRYLYVDGANRVTAIQQ